ncbi:MAG TPA: hypothetical protein VF654_09645, partial [Pyrinomonadaceae bacterium]
AHHHHDAADELKTARASAASAASEFSPAFQGRVEVETNRRVASATPERAGLAHASLTRRGALLIIRVPALKGRAKLTPPLTRRMPAAISLPATDC